MPRTTGVDAIGVTNAGASDVARERGDHVVSQSPLGAAVEEAETVTRSIVDMEPGVSGGTPVAQVALTAASVGDAGGDDQREERGSGMTHLTTC